MACWKGKPGDADGFADAILQTACSAGDLNGGFSRVSDYGQREILAGSFSCIQLQLLFLIASQFQQLVVVELRGYRNRFVGIIVDSQRLVDLVSRSHFKRNLGF